MSEFFDSIKDKAGDLKDKLTEELVDKLGLNKSDWPQTVAQPPFGKPGFLPPQLITPTLKTQRVETTQVETANSNVVPIEIPEVKRNGAYFFTDWTGYKITESPEYKISEFRGNSLGTKDRFELSRDLPKQASDLKSEPYSTRDTYLLYNDATADYFRHSLQVVDNLNTDFPEVYPLKKGEDSTSRLYNFKETPYENNDPVMFGFEIIIDAVSSPLLNGSIFDFLDQFSLQNNELRARYEVYEDFKNQFKKLFKTKGTVRVDESYTKMTNLGNNPATVEGNQKFFNPGRRAYMAYFLKKVDGLSSLSEKNTPTAKKYITDYGKDIIKLEFYEDVSLTLGTLAHLYKLLYWSKPNGKGMIPENLLRFNCDIIVSECRNYNRTRKAAETGQLEIIKDNVSRYVYSLRECQFYFDLYTHPDSVDNSSPIATDQYTVQFDFKYSSVKFERWTPGANNFGKYVGYNNGALWKLGNVPSRGATYSIPVPRFLTMGENPYYQNGVTSPFVLRNSFNRAGEAETPLSPIPDPQVPNLEEDDLAKQALNQLKEFGQRQKKKAKSLAEQSKNRLIASAAKEAQSIINTQFALLNKAINKILNKKGISKMNPPRNIYTDSALDLRGRLFYDVRGELLNFAGSILGNQILSPGAGVGGTIVVPPKPSTGSPFQQDSRTAFQLYGTSDFTQIQFPYYAQRYPPPIT